MSIPNGSSPPTATMTQSTFRWVDGTRAVTRAERSGRTPSVVSVALLTTWRSGSPTISTKIVNCDVSSPRLAISMATLMLVPSGEHRATITSCGCGLTNRCTARPRATAGMVSMRATANTSQGHLRRFICGGEVMPSGSTWRAPSVETSAVHDMPLNQRWS